MYKGGGGYKTYHKGRSMTDIVYFTVLQSMAGQGKLEFKNQYYEMRKGDVIHGNNQQ